jgi:hypothetical protein
MSMPGVLSKFAVSFWLCLVGASLAPMALAQDAPAPPASAPIPSDEDLAKADCILGEERFLPGDYYYCLGSLTYGEHKYEESRRFFTTAASWASKPAQFVLSVMALNGDHQPRDRALALAWVTLAAERPDSRFKSSFDQLYKASTPKERKAADVLLEKMRPVYGDATAAVRAETRYRDGMAALQRQDKPGQIYCMQGMFALNGPYSGPTSPCQPVMVYTQTIDKAAVNVFDGWNGHVTVGPLQPVPTPGKSTN